MGFPELQSRFRPIIAKGRKKLDRTPSFVLGNTRQHKPKPPWFLIYTTYLNARESNLPDLYVF
jgi:hypothetical protein